MAGEISQFQELIKKIDQIQSEHLGAVSFPPQIFPRDKELKNTEPLLSIFNIQPQKEETLVFFSKLKDVLVVYEAFSFLEELEEDRNYDLSLAFLKREKEAIETVAAALEAKTSVFMFFLRELLRPWAKTMAASYIKQLPLDNWLFSICPFCGHPAAGARQEKGEGKRFLICSLCETEWAFKRVRCPECGNDDHHTLGYFTADGLDDWRVSFCRKCGSYIKEAINNKPVKVLDIELQISLDILAKKEGFHPLFS